MKNKVLIFSLILFITFSSLSCYAGLLTLNKMLGKLSTPRLTSLQKSNLVEQYKGQEVKGIGKVKDILKSFASENTAMLYIEKPFRGKRYEIVLVVSQNSVKKIKKGQRIRFEGKFVGITFNTLRFEDAKLIHKSWWPF